MNALLIGIAAYLALDALLTIAATGKTVVITPGSAVLTTVTRAVMVVVLLLAALGGVRP